MALASSDNIEDITPTEYQILDWDSEFFGVKVARITQPSLTADNLTDILSELEAKSVKLVYLASDRECDADEAKSIRGHLVDTKLTFAADLRRGHYDSPGSADIVEAYAQSMRLADIEDLAIQNGEYSRFAVDPTFQEKNS